MTQIPAVRIGTFLAFISVATMVTSLYAGSETWPVPQWQKATPQQMGMDPALLNKARDYALTGGGSGYITRSGKLVMAWGDPRKKYDLKSTTKSIGITALALAVKDGKMKLTDQARQHHPNLGTPPARNTQTGWLDNITLLHLATHTAGFEKPGGYSALKFKPGTRWNYSDGGPNWLAECITLEYKRDLEAVMFQRVFTPIGIKPRDLSWRKNAYRPRKINKIERREFGSGISANVDAMARIGYLYLRRGKWQQKQIIPESFIDRVRTTVPSVVKLPVNKPKVYPNASKHYGLLWWNNADGTLAGVPRDAYWSWGLYESLIVVIPSLDIVAARAGNSWQKKPTAGYKILQTFIGPIAASVRQRTAKCKPPYPPSPAIAKLTWAEPHTIVRQAAGSDNWPITWADDGNLYTAFGDGWGFKEPKISAKLSLGIARIVGPPENFKGINIRSPDIEQTGDGHSGKKASGMLMVEGVLYMWIRNAGNSQLAFSADRGKSWKFCPWKFTTSFGCPTFCNFGKNYAHARDEYVYVYSQDRDSAYASADRMVLARVHKNKITEHNAYRFFAGLDNNGKPKWTGDISARAGVFANPGRCYRSSVCYNPDVKRYLWCQVIPHKDKTSNSGLGIFDAPRPWGPWTTLWYTESWDVDPGESAGFTVKWFGQKGQALYLVFSGNDSFSVRKAVIWPVKKP